MFFEKSENIFSGIFQAAQAAKRRAWGGNPNKIPIGQNERLAKFGTVVESCSKKVTASHCVRPVQSPLCRRSDFCQLRLLSILQIFRGVLASADKAGGAAVSAAFR